MLRVFPPYPPELWSGDALRHCHGSCRLQIREPHLVPLSPLLGITLEEFDQRRCFAGALARVRFIHNVFG